jgi:hypothetical protein
MSKQLSYLFAIGLCAVAVPSAQAGGPSGAIHSFRPQPRILSALVDTGQHRLFIHGVNFDQQSPSVTLGDSILSVLQASSTEIIASLPQGTPASTYLLTVSAADDLSRSETFNLQVGEGEVR